MKKLIFFFTVAAIALITGCKNRDYGCNWYYEIENKTEYELICIKGTTEISITPNSTRQIYRTGTECGKNDVPEDTHHDAEELLFPSYQLKLNGNLISNTIWKRNFWAFESKVHHATYTLIITDELIENLK